MEEREKIERKKYFLFGHESYKNLVVQTIKET
jgi:hypothetical protein